ncbi:MAG: NAD-dependent epimerase/dehydratase family protein [Proteobacteria bacterium]|nr:NAD-dependent epimerase/dehydratase family protein [Pseudomonadota bacterium]MBU1058841.1 NAD-dependent epimerase/dehydratase family protein [Pseudomonadota bacterium]
MKVLMTGGSGFVGRFLSALLLEKGCAVTALGGHSHDNLSLHPGVHYVVADTSQEGGLINPAGRSGVHLWRDSYKGPIYDSRSLTARLLPEALPADKGPKVLISTAAAGFYGNPAVLLLQSGVSFSFPRLDMSLDNLQ